MTNGMSLKEIVVLFSLASVAFAERPYVGLQVPSLPQVVGGEDAPIGAYPYIVSLQYEGIHFCGGSILNNNLVVTAAHCIHAVPSKGKFAVKAGKHNIKQTEATEQESLVKKTIVHKKYKGEVGPYDIALIKLKTPLIFSKEVQPIELAQAESEPNGHAILCGWGSISQTRIPKSPETLQHVNMTFVDRTICNEAFLRLGERNSIIHETNVCTGPLDGGIAACSGDSGGPLISRHGNKTVLEGIVSWGIVPCGTVGAPSVYARVSKFNSWIAQNDANSVNKRVYILSIFMLFIPSLLR